MTKDELDICKKRQKECLLVSEKFSQRLSKFELTNWVTVIVPSILAIAAGSAFFSSGDDWKLFVGISTLVAALLGALHKGLKCDEYQAEYRRLIHAYDGLAIRYRTLYETQIENGLDDFLKLEDHLAQLHENAIIRMPIT